MGAALVDCPNVSLETPLRAYQTIREFWAFVDEVEVNEMSLSNDAIQWKNVFREEHSREGRPAVAYIDMVSIFIPPPYAETSLRSIRIIDTSMDNLKSIDPGLIVTGITVETR